MTRINKWAVYLISVVILIMAFLLILVILLQSFTKTGREKQMELNLALQTTHNYADIMATFGGAYVTDTNTQYISDLYEQIQYDAESDLYVLDERIPGVPESFGSLSGSGPIPSDREGLSELQLVFRYQSLFASFHAHQQDLAWIYYTSARGFIFMYPTVTTAFTYTPELTNVPFFLNAAPKANPERNTIWTEVYMDEAGKGLMVTISSPVYREDAFLGVVSLDLTTGLLREILDNPYNGFLIDRHGDVIATGQNEGFSEGVQTLDTLLPLNEQQADRVLNMESESIRLIGTQIVYTYQFGTAPWNLVLTQSIFQTAGLAVLLLLPAMVICILWLRARRESETRRRAEAHMRTIAWTDELTGLKNRYYLDSVIERDLSHADRYGRPLSVIMFDLDLFKHVNDTYGHDIGDQVLKHTADVVMQHIRKADTFSRIGGEEFLILLPETSQEGAFETAEKIRVVLEQTVHPVAGICTASFGVAQRSLGETYSSLYRRADEALYQAKGQGRNRVVSYTNILQALEIQWDNTWECGEKTIDLQHEGVVKLATDILSAGISSSDPARIGRLLNNLLYKISEHFEYEEKVLNEIGFPGAAQHREIHNDLLKEARRNQERFQDGHLKTTALFSFLFDKLIIQHLLEEDIHYFPYLNAEDAHPSSAPDSDPV